MQTPWVEIELVDGVRYGLQRIEPEPGFGMVTLFVRGEAEDDPDAVIIPIGSIRRIELRKQAEERVGAGFYIPS